MFLLTREGPLLLFVSSYSTCALMGARSNLRRSSCGERDWAFLPFFTGFFAVAVAFRATVFLYLLVMFWILATCRFQGQTNREQSYTRCAFLTSQNDKKEGLGLKLEVAYSLCWHLTSAISHLFLIAQGKFIKPF
jgi:hypothetical protein